MLWSEEPAIENAVIVVSSGRAIAKGLAISGTRPASCMPNRIAWWRSARRGLARRTPPLLCYTGCRRNEIWTLRWCGVGPDAFDLDDGKRGLRMVYLNRLARTGSDYVRPSASDPSKSIPGFSSLWLTLRRRLGLEDVRLYGLRHYSRVRLTTELMPECVEERASGVLHSGVITGCSGSPAHRRRAGIVRPASATSRTFSGVPVSWPQRNASGPVKARFGGTTLQA